MSVEFVCVSVLKVDLGWLRCPPRAKARGPTKRYWAPPPARGRERCKRRVYLFVFEIPFPVNYQAPFPPICSVEMVEVMEDSRSSSGEWVCAVRGAPVLMRWWEEEISKDLICHYKYIIIASTVVLTLKKKTKNFYPIAGYKLQVCGLPLKSADLKLWFIRLHVL